MVFFDHRSGTLQSEVDTKRRNLMAPNDALRWYTVPINDQIVAKYFISTYGNRIVSFEWSDKQVTHQRRRYLVPQMPQVKQLAQKKNNKIAVIQSTRRLRSHNIKNRLRKRPENK